MISKLLENSGLKDLGIHTEMAPAGTHRLVDKGVVTCKYKKVNPGKILLAFTMGDKELYDFLGNNPMVRVPSDQLRQQHRRDLPRRRTSWPSTVPSRST